jgi:hypothetical protein
MQNVPEVQFRFRRPSGSRSRKPSTAMQAALHYLSRAREMQPLIKRARQTGRAVVIDVFHGSNGQPLLIHPTVVSGGANE